MKLTSKNFNHGESIPDEFAFCTPDAVHQVALSNNKNPALEWSDTPEGCKSFVLLCVDVDVPTKPDDVNQADREVPHDLARTDFFHWVMTDIPKDIQHIPAGAYSNEVTTRGKQSPKGPVGSKQGLNDYTQWFNGDENMQGQYYGYDGPCPPWNDSIIHHYHFIIYALDIETCNLEGEFTGQNVKQAIEGHILAEASIIGTYTLNPRLR